MKYMIRCLGQETKGTIDVHLDNLQQTVSAIAQEFMAECDSSIAGVTYFDGWNSFEGTMFRDSNYVRPTNITPSRMRVEFDRLDIDMKVEVFVEPFSRSVWLMAGVISKKDNEDFYTLEFDSDDEEFGGDEYEIVWNVQKNTWTNELNDEVILRVF